MKRYMQRLGRAFLLPVSVLPVVSILLGIGYTLDFVAGRSLGILPMFLIHAGKAIIEHIPLLFAVGISVGLAREKDGSAALSGLAGYLVVTGLLSPEAVAQYRGIAISSVDPSFHRIENVFISILVGIIASQLYDRYSTRELPQSISFFSGRRLVPILTVFFSMMASAVLYFIWPVLYSALVTFGSSVAGLGAVGAGIYGFLNRILIPTGLHHALNAVFWFDTVGINDLGKFWSGDGVRGVTGMYMAGFFPMMMFGMAGAALAMYHTARPERKKAVGSMLLAGAVSAFVTGLTEPIEFLFMFLSPMLYFIHAVLTGLSLFIAALMKWTAGFNFSAGLMDFVLSAMTPMANRPYMLMVQGVVFFFIYYFIFRYFIVRFDLTTPGREKDGEEVSYVDLGGGNVKDTDEDLASESSEQKKSLRRKDGVAEVILIGLGGAGNISSLDYCATRLRVEVRDDSRVDKERIRSSGVLNVTSPSEGMVHVIVGPKVQSVADDVRRLMDEEKAGTD